MNKLYGQSALCFQLSPEWKEQASMYLEFLNKQEPLRWSEPTVQDLRKLLDVDNEEFKRLSRNPDYSRYDRFQVSLLLDEGGRKEGVDFVPVPAILNSLAELPIEEFNKALGFPLPIENHDNSGGMGGNHGGATMNLLWGTVFESALESLSPRFKVGSFYMNAGPVFERAVFEIFQGKVSPDGVKIPLGSKEYLLEKYPELKTT